MNNPLYEKVRKIVAGSSNANEIKHSQFEDIRNQASVRAILKDMGYKPCNEARPYTWRLIAIESKSNNKIQVKRETKARPIVDILNSNKVLMVDEQAIPRDAVQKIVWNLRNKGHVITNVMKDNKLIGYKLAQ